MLDVACNWIDVCDELDEDVKDRAMNLDRRENFDVMIDLAVIVAHVIDDDVKNVIDDVVEADVNAWFNITANSYIVKNSFENDEFDVLWFWIIDVTDAKNEMKLDVNVDVKISDVIFDFLI